MWDGVEAGTAEQYAKNKRPASRPSARSNGRPKTGERQPLGVFAMVQDGETKATNIFQLAVNKDGVIRGEHYNATTDTAERSYGRLARKLNRKPGSCSTARPQFTRQE